MSAASAAGPALPASFGWPRRLLAFGSALAGTALVGGLLHTMNQAVEGPEAGARREVQQVVMTPKQTPPKPKPARQRRQRPKPSKAPPPPADLLSGSLSGLSFGLESLAVAGLEDAADALLGDASSAVMTAGSVDSPPRAVSRAAPEYPPRARAKGLTGYVAVSVLIAADGSIQDLRVLESEPPGTFDRAALDAVGRWRFEPATYEGLPVAVRVRQVVRFELE